MRRLLAVLLLPLACGPGAEGPSDESVTIAQYREGLTASGAGGCDTNIAQGLSNQLVEELNCLSPNLMVSFAGPHVTLYSSVIPYLAPDAASALISATVARNDTMTVSSAYRTLVQQYLLYKWWKAGQCGIQVAAVPGSSNHQSGRAIDTPYYSAWRAALTARGWSWLGSSDLVHFDHLASPNIASKSVLAFQRLWNKNHATGKLAEDGAWGPASQAAMASSPVTGFATHGCPTTGKLAGTITQQGSGAPLSGVLVSAGGRSDTTGADGAFSLTLGPGAVTVTAAKAGFITASLSRTVPVGGTVSASMALSPVVTTGTLVGTVVDQPGAPIAAARVAVGAQVLTTDAAGAFRVELPAGAVTVAVSKAGYQAGSATATVVVGASKSVKVVLLPGALTPSLEVESPVSGATVAQARVTLVGTAQAAVGTLASLELVHNQQAPVPVAVTAGRFEVQLLLAPGMNTVHFKAVDSAGRAAQATWTGSFRAGFGGLVHGYQDLASPIVDAELTLLAPQSQAVVGRARSDAQGHFELDAAATGTHVLQVAKAGFTPRALLIDVSAEERTTVDVGLTPGDDSPPALRFIEPTEGAMLEADEVVVSGAVTGLEVAGVSINGQEAQLLGNGFVLRMPLPEGRTSFEAVAQSAEGFTVRSTVTVRRPLGPVRGGCAASPGLSLAALGAAAVRLLLRRRRRSAGLERPSPRRKPQASGSYASRQVPHSP